MNRLDDFKITFPFMVLAAKASPPVEIAIMDYGSTDGLDEFMESIHPIGYELTYKRLMHPYYHVAHARNLAILISHGEWFINMSADTLVTERLVKIVRERIERYRPIYMDTPILGGIMACQRAEFIAAGGFDERIELYGPEDNEFRDRLVRRGAKRCGMPIEATIIPTSNSKKVENFRPKQGNKSQQSRKMRVIREENVKNNLLVANSEGWGRWI